MNNNTDMNNSNDEDNNGALVVEDTQVGEADDDDEQEHTVVVPRSPKKRRFTISAKKQNLILESEEDDEKGDEQARAAETTVTPATNPLQGPPPPAPADIVDAATSRNETTAASTTPPGKSGPPLWKRTKKLIAALRGDMTPARHYLDDKLATLDEMLPSRREFCNFYLPTVLWHALSLLDMALRGISQVYLVNNTISGLLMVIGLALSSDPMLAIFVLLGSALATCGGSFAFNGALFPSGIDSADFSAGLYGYDGTLVAAGIKTFLRPNAQVLGESVDVPNSASANGTMLLSALVLCFVAGFLRKAFGRVFSTFQIPAFTWTFNSVTLIILFGVRDGGINLFCIGDCYPATSNSTSVAASSINTDFGVFWIDAFITGVGQLIFADTRLASIFIILALGWSNLEIAAQACAGSIFGGLFAFALAGWPGAATIASNPAAAKAAKTLGTGLFGYNSCATVIVAMGASTSHSERVHLRALFEMVDQSGDGLLDRGEVRAFLEMLLRVRAGGALNPTAVGTGQQQRRPSTAEAGRAKRRASSTDEDDREQQHKHQDDEEDEDDDKDNNEDDDEFVVTIPQEDFDEFFESIPRREADSLTFPEFAAWWNSLLVQSEDNSSNTNSSSNSGTTTTNDQQRSHDALSIVAERKAPLVVRMLNALVFVFVTVIIAPFAAERVAPLPILTIPFCTASWLFKLTRDEGLKRPPSTAIAPASQPAQQQRQKPDEVVDPGAANVNAAALGAPHNRQQSLIDVSAAATAANDVGGAGFFGEHQVSVQDLGASSSHQQHSGVFSSNHNNNSSHHHLLARGASSTHSVVSSNGSPHVTGGSFSSRLSPRTGGSNRVLDMLMGVRGQSFSKSPARPN